MAISYSPGAGTLIDEFAADETLGDQSQQTNDDTVVMSDDISTAPPGNGNIGSEKAGYTGRLVIVNLASTPQVRMCTGEAAGDGNTIILTVGEDWGTNPVQSDTIHVCYCLDDIESGGAGSGIGLNSKSGLYELTNDLTIGGGTNATGLQINAGEGLEADDTGSTLQNFVANNGYLFMGYEQGGVSLDGGILTFVNNTDGEPTWQIQSGGKTRIFDSLIWAQLNALYWEGVNGNDAQYTDSKLLSIAYGSEFFDSTLIRCSISGRGGVSELVRFDAGTTINGLTLLNTAGLTTADGSTTTENITARDVAFVNNVDNIIINSNKTWYLINPVWTITSYNDALFNWLTTTSNYVYDQRSIDAVVQEADGTKIQNANVLIYENTTLGDLVLETYTDANGVAAGVFTLYYHTGSATTTYGGHALRVDCWLYSPFIATQISTESFDSVVVLSTDTAIDETTQATALSNGSGITWNEDANPSSIIEFEGGTGTLSVGNTVTGGTSSADGIVTKIIEGNSVAGIVHLKSRDANDFSGTEDLGNGAGWSATLVSASQQDFSIWVDGVTKSMQIIYDYFAALTSETTLSANGELIHEWGRDSQGRALIVGVSGFSTERSYSKGIFVTNYGVGTIEYFTDDAGVTWSPAATVTLEVNGVKTGVEPTNYVRCHIEADTGGDEVVGTILMNEKATTSYGAAGFYKATEAYSYTGTPQPAIVRARYKGYLPFSTTGIVDSNGLTVTAVWIADPNFTP